MELSETQYQYIEQSKFFSQFVSRYGDINWRAELCDLAQLGYIFPKCLHERKIPRKM